MKDSKIVIINKVRGSDITMIAVMAGEIGAVPKPGIRRSQVNFEVELQSQSRSQVEVGKNNFI